MADEENILPPASPVRPDQQAQRESRPEEAQELVHVGSSGSLAQLPLTGAIRNLTRISNEAGMVLLRAHTERLENDLKQTRADHRNALETATEWMEKYYGEVKQSAVLTEQLAALRSIKNIQKYIGAVGGIAAGTAFSNIITGVTGWGIAALILSCSLLVAGFWPASTKHRA
jgi:hypothetical protein